MISFSQTVYTALIYASNELPYGSLIVKIIKLNLCIRVSHKHLIGGGSTAPPPLLEWAPGVGDRGSN